MNQGDSATVRSDAVEPTVNSTETSLGSDPVAPPMRHEVAITTHGAHPRPRRVRWLGTGLLLLLSVLSSALMAEALLRLFPQFQVQTGDGEFLFCGSSQVRHRPHPTFGYTEVPGNRYFERYSKSDPWAYVQINAEGFRDNYDNHGQPVIVLGDSMTRGTLVNEEQTYTDLLDLWHPGLAFRNYGTGGYGQAHAIRVYEDNGRRLPHRLVIQQVSLSTDLDDNVERAKLRGDTAEITIEPAVGQPSRSLNPAVATHQLLWSHTRLYPWFYTVAVYPWLGNWDARKDVGTALELMRRLMAQLADRARSNDADLVILVLPSWAEMAGHDDAMAPERQRDMLRRFAAAQPGVFIVDMTPILARHDPNRTYGVVDKHLTPYGHFLVATALERWLVETWPRGPHATAPVRKFHLREALPPRCDLAAKHLQRVLSPEL